MLFATASRGFKGARAGTLLALAVLAAGRSHWPFLPILVAKTPYGALLGAVTGGLAVRAALGDLQAG